MKFRQTVLLVCGLCCLGGQGPLAAPTQQDLLVLCSGDACEYRRVSSFLVGGRQSVRLLAAPAEKVGSSELKNSQELNLGQVAGLYRDPRSGTFYRLAPDGQPRGIVVPGKVSAKDAASPSALWKTETLEYNETPNAKTRTTVAHDSFAYLFVSSDSEQAAFQFLQRLLDPSQTDPRRLALIRGALQFTGKSPNVQRWRTSLVARMRDDLNRFDNLEGDPTTLGDALRDAVEIRGIYLQVADDKTEKELVDRIVVASDLFRRRVTAADALRKAMYWDEYLTKIRQLGLAKWSMPNILENSREALNQSAKVHQQHFTSFAGDGHLDRAFDEAELAARNSCEADVIDDFYRARVLLVNHNQIASSSPYAGPQKALLEQIVREFDQLDPTKEQLTLAGIRRGEQLDPNFLPLQLKKAEFLDKLGRYQEALEVVQRIERTVRLDHAQLDEYLRLDGRIKNNLTDAVQKSQEETRKQFEAQKYQPTLDAAVKGLRANPGNASLLYYSALSAAFLRQRAAAIKLVRTYLNDANLACAPSGEPEKVLELYRLLATAAPPKEGTDGIPNWISGVRYHPGQVFYDPISLGFLQPVARVSADDVSTIFFREDRSFLVKSILTSTGTPKDSNSGPGRTVFEAEPKYDRQTLSMLEIGSRANSAGDRISYALTYLNSPSVDPDLVLHFTGHQIARGWAGNPFFHPFIWSGLYVFDLAYDRLGRVSTATPIREEAGARTDPFSEPLKFNWEGDSNRLLSIKGARNGYVRELNYDKDGRLRSETISFPKGHGTIEYEYLSDGPLLKSAKFQDNFYDKRERLVNFDVSQGAR